MKVNELRIGNFVSDIHSETGMWKICSLGIKTARYGNFNPNIYSTTYDKLRPIPLTPEILEKCGIKDIWIKNSWKVVEDVSGGESFGWSMKVRNANHDKEIEFAYFKYLHQLQNLYFSITGEELTFKP